VKSPSDNAQMLLYVRLIGGEPRDFIETSLGAVQISLLHVDHTQVVPCLDILQLHLHDLEEARLGCGQVAVVVDVNVTEQYQALDVVWMMLQTNHGILSQCRIQMTINRLIKPVAMQHSILGACPKPG